MKFRWKGALISLVIGLFVYTLATLTNIKFPFLFYYGMCLVWAGMYAEELVMSGK